MQKIFPLAGSGQVSELRFKPTLSGAEVNDEGDEFPEWEEKRLGKILNITTGSSNRQDPSLEGKLATLFLYKISCGKKHADVSA